MCVEKSQVLSKAMQISHLDGTTLSCLMFNSVILQSHKESSPFSLCNFPVILNNSYISSSAQFHWVEKKKLTKAFLVPRVKAIVLEIMTKIIVSKNTFERIFEFYLVHFFFRQCLEPTSLFPFWLCEHAHGLHS
jgi:hypothetical protein